MMFHYDRCGGSAGFSPVSRTCCIWAQYKVCKIYKQYYCGIVTVFLDKQKLKHFFTLCKISENLGKSYQLALQCLTLNR